MQSSSNGQAILGGLSERVLQTYQTIRYSKMSQLTSTTEQIIDVHLFHQELNNLQDELIKFRVHYNLTTKELDFLKTPVQSLIQAFLKYNRPCQFNVLHLSDDYETLDISFNRNLLLVFMTDAKIVSLLEVATLLEIGSVSKANKSFAGVTCNQNFSTKYVLYKENYVQNPVLKRTTPPEYVDLWLSLLRDKWNEFYSDINGKECSLDYYTNGQYKIRRKLQDGTPVVFTKVQDLDWLQDLQAVAIIPNAHTKIGQKRPVSVEAIVDIDPSRFTTEEEKIKVFNTMTSYLNQRNFQFKAHLSSGSHSGFHKIIPLEITHILDLVTNQASPQNYFNNLYEKILINSVRESTVALLLDYLKTYKSEGILDIASLEPDPYKIHLEVSRIAYNLGRRAIYSMHRGTNSVVLPLPPNEPLTVKKLNYYTDLSQIDHCYAKSELLHEKTIYLSAIKKNTLLLEQSNQELQELWRDYQKSPNKKKFIKKL